MSKALLVDHFFRHEYSRLVAHFTNQYGWQNIHQIEDAVQSALLSGLESWTRNGEPDNPTAWLYRVVQNEMLSFFRTKNRRDSLLQQQSGLEEMFDELEGESLTRELSDDLLRTLFVCCHEQVPLESQLAIALKVLCGFNVAEIAHRLFISEANTYKRIQRAQQKLASFEQSDFEFSLINVRKRLKNVHQVIYLLFTEGYLSVNNEYGVRYDLCAEAVRLGQLLIENSDTKSPETFALNALMQLQLARMSGRTDSAGGLLLLEEQDRNKWDKKRIEIGLNWLGESAQGNDYSRYHAEAGVAAEHCLAENFEDTRWDRIAKCYLLLEQKHPSSIHRLNRAVAIAQWQGPEAGLAILEEAEPPGWLLRSYLWSAVKADLHTRAGHAELGNRFMEEALHLAPTSAVKQLLNRRFLQSISYTKHN